MGCLSLKYQVVHYVNVICHGINYVYRRVQYHKIDEISSCAQLLFVGKFPRNWTSVCSFQCFDNTNVLVTQLSVEKYILTNVRGKIELQCSTKDNKAFTLLQNLDVRSLQVVLPCDCELLLNGQVTVLIKFV